MKRWMQIAAGLSVAAMIAIGGHLGVASAAPDAPMVNCEVEKCTLTYSTSGYEARIGWANLVDAKREQQAGNWLRAFHFTDQDPAGEYTVEGLKGGEAYYFIVAAKSEDGTRVAFRFRWFGYPADFPTQTGVQKAYLDPGRRQNTEKLNHLKRNATWYQLGLGHLERT